MAGLLALGVALLLFDLGRWWRARRPRDDGGYPERGGEAVPSRGAMHYSGYVFRDRNRSGRLDLGDAPMAWVALAMTAPDGRREMARSNLSGFANFDMSLHRRTAQIRAPGEYRFRLRVPPGWLVTTDNAEQRSRIERLDGAPGDLVSRDPIRPFGLAPELTLSGRCLERRKDGSFAAAANARVEASGPDLRTTRVPVGADGSFRMAALVGGWELRIADGSSAPALVRHVVMRDAPVHVGGLVLGDDSPAANASPASPAVVDFEGVTGFGTGKVPSGYAGLDWDYLNALDPLSVAPPGYVNTLASGRYVGYSSSGFAVTISRRGGFDFHGGYFGIGLQQAHGEHLHARAYRGDTLVADDEVVLSVLGPVWLDAEYGDVDRVVLSTARYWQFAVDDLSVSVPGGDSNAASAAASRLTSGAASVAIAGSPKARATAAPSQ
ncbi:MAG TPA: hypothetical protein VN923_04295 [Thermoanaerobaculia bacterium]|nr:hypothetical protein [Thermoanaerobaculia bacterium]